MSESKNQAPVTSEGAPIQSPSPTRVRAIELLEWIEDYALADADLGEVASRASDAIRSLSALEDLLYHLEPFLAAAAVVIERPHEYQPAVARIGGLGNARDLRVEDFQRLVKASAALANATSPSTPDMEEVSHG